MLKIHYAYYYALFISYYSYSEHIENAIFEHRENSLKKTQLSKTMQKIQE